MQIYTQKITIIKKGFLMLEGNCWSIFVISITDENECIVYARKVQKSDKRKQIFSSRKEKSGNKNTKIPSSQHMLRKNT